MSHAMQGHPTQTGHSEESGQNVIHWRRKWQPTPVFLLQKPHENMKRQNDMTLEDELKRSESVQHATREEWRALVTRSRKDEETGPKQK